MVVLSSYYHPLPARFSRWNYQVYRLPADEDVDFAHGTTYTRNITNCRMDIDMPEFELHPQLVTDTVAIRDLVLSRLLLMNDRRFPWFILVPKRPDVSEIVDLCDEDRSLLWREIDAVAHAAKAVFSPDKLNIAALGNVVPQLHVHIIARFRNDAIWPKVVWGFGTGEPYAPGEAETVMSACASFLLEHGW
jgi:diadenosine tetraphosphate (Ap4A) HIT family hydrolase